MWLLFTDADTVHLAGSLARALAEAKQNRADLLSYSPEQIVVTFWEKAVMPVVFAELAAEYPPAKVRDPNSGIVAANGQYILVRRDAYEAVGGHEAVAGSILEDVALARKFQTAGHRSTFPLRSGRGAHRMYRKLERTPRRVDQESCAVVSAPRAASDRSVNVVGFLVDLSRLWV